MGRGFFRKHARWPHANSGPIEGAPGENWYRINSALYHGIRGLPGGGSISHLLSAKEGLKISGGRAPLTVDEILTWADAHFKREGEWPRAKNSEPIPGTPGETWLNISQALNCGHRGLPRTTLFGLLQQHRGICPGAKQILREDSRLTLEQILEWSDDYFRRNGKWPKKRSGAIDGSHGETWYSVNTRLAGRGAAACRKAVVAGWNIDGRGIAGIRSVLTRRPSASRKYSNGRRRISSAPGSGLPAFRAPSLTLLAKSGRPSISHCARDFADWRADRRSSIFSRLTMPWPSGASGRFSCKRKSWNGPMLISNAHGDWPRCDSGSD